jgi:hypothetical protein
LYSRPKREEEEQNQLKFSKLVKREKEETQEIHTEIR